MEDIEFAFDRIKLAAPTWGIDLTSPAFTVWLDHPARSIYCGSRKTLNSACLLALDQPQKKGLYIVKGSPLGILRVRDG